MDIFDSEFEFIKRTRFKSYGNNGPLELVEIFKYYSSADAGQVPHKTFKKMMWWTSKDLYTFITCIKIKKLFF